MSEAWRAGGPSPGQATAAEPLPLFPLRTVLYPGGVLPLKVFEARYLDLIGECLRTQRLFGVVCLAEGAEAGAVAGGVRLESVGTLARIDDVDAQQAGILHVRCSGTQRFRMLEAAAQDRVGLWSAPVALLPDDAVVEPPAQLQPTVQALARAAEQLARQGQAAIATPLRLDDAGWVANRWCELLPIALDARQKLLELADPVARLHIVQELLRELRVLDD